MTMKISIIRRGKSKQLSISGKCGAVSRIDGHTDTYNNLILPRNHSYSTCKHLKSKLWKEGSENYNFYLVIYTYLGEGGQKSLKVLT